MKVDQTSTSRKQTENLDPTPAPTPQPSSHPDEAMEVDLYGPSLLPHLGDDQSMYDSDPRHVLDQHSGQSDEPTQVLSARPKIMQIKENTRLGPSTCLHL